MFALAIIAGLAPAPAFAVTIAVAPATVPGISRDGRCSLIEAIVNANNDAATHTDCVAGTGADVIVLPHASTHLLTKVHNTSYGATGLPVITSTITIEGKYSTIARTSSAPAFRIFAVGTGARLRLNQITVTGGATASVGKSTAGGGAANYGGTLEVTNSTIANNTATTRGGGIYSQLGVLIVTDSTLSHNSAPIGGGAAQSDNTTTLTNNVISNNKATKFDGGGVYGEASTVTLSRNTVTANSAYHGGAMRHEWNSRVIVRDSTISDNYGRTSGGGLENGPHSTLVVFDSTVSGNVTDGGGGGVSHEHMADLTLIKSSTISGNTAVKGGGISAWGGGTTHLISSTLSFNHASTGGGGGVKNDRGPLILCGNLVTGNTTNGFGPEIYNTGGAVVVANNYNLFGHNGQSGVVGFTPGGKDIVASGSLGAMLDDTLRDNGGPTFTHALTPGSRAIDAGDPAFDDLQWGVSHIFDQRGPGFARFVNGRIDIGAFEAQP